MTGLRRARELECLKRCYMSKFVFGLLAFFMLLLFTSSSLAVTVDDLNGKLSNPIFSRLPEGAYIGIFVYRGDWSNQVGLLRFYHSVPDGPILEGNVYQYPAHFYDIPEGYFDMSRYDFVVGVKEDFLESVLRVSDLCSFAKSLPRNPDHYRVLDYDLWSFLWKYRCFSGEGCLKKYCGGSA